MSSSSKRTFNEDQTQDGCDIPAKKARLFICECGAICSTKGNLKRHKERNEAKLNADLCPDCGLCLSAVQLPDDERRKGTTKLAFHKKQCTGRPGPFVSEETAAKVRMIFVTMRDQRPKCAEPRLGISRHLRLDYTGLNTSGGKNTSRYEERMTSLSAQSAPIQTKLQLRPLMTTLDVSEILDIGKRYVNLIDNMKWAEACKLIEYCLEFSHGKYASPAGRAKVLAMIAKQQPHVDVSAMTLDWWKANITDVLSKLLVTCTRCKITCNNTSINQIQIGKGFGCGCRYKTEMLVFDEIKDNAAAYPEQKCLLCDRPGYYKPDWALSTRDMGILLTNGIEVNIEVDGPHHFFEQVYDIGKVTNPEERARRDGDNCRAAINAGVWVVRFYQMDVIRNFVDWTAYYARALRLITHESTPKIIVPESAQNQYKIWAERAGLGLEDLIFLADKKAVSKD